MYVNHRRMLSQGCQAPGVHCVCAHPVRLTAWQNRAYFLYCIKLPPLVQLHLLVVAVRQVGGVVVRVVVSKSP